MTEQELYDHAVSLRAKKNYSSGDMHRQLARLTEKMDGVELVLRRLTDNHDLNDPQLIASLIDKHITRLHGPTRIKQAIRQKRVSASADRAGNGKERH